ncbi:MAG: hypothetical protein NVSMB9_22810 [Isosphaeraceae bacterium]
MLGTVFMATLSLWVVWRWWNFQSYQRAMTQIQEEMDNGRNAVAASALNALLAWKPDSDEAIFLLGTCEMARGRIEAADRAFARVRPDSRFTPQAILGRLQLRMGQGRYAAAEEVVRDALNDSRVDRAGLPLLLGPLYFQEGRLEETLRLVEKNWEALNGAGEGSSEQAINLARTHGELRTNPVPTEVIRAALDQAGRSAPEDDRVWLGKANLAIGDGSYDAASNWLDACRKRRPQDVPVWRARLNWAMATKSVAAAREALEHLPAEDWSPAGIQKLAAWLAARRGDVGSERRALETLLDADPADLEALDRLAELAAKDGQKERAAALVREKAEIGRLQARYDKLYRRNQPARDAAEMGRLAARLGRGFEARAFLTLATAMDADNKDLRNELSRLDRASQETLKPGATLAEVLSARLDFKVDPPTRASTSSH